MIFFRDADKELKALGFEKYEENDIGVTYHKTVPEHLYIHVLYIGHKHDGYDVFQSYQMNPNSEDFNNCVGLTYKEMGIAMKKYKEMKRKYKWKG